MGIAGEVQSLPNMVIHDVGTGGPCIEPAIDRSSGPLLRALCFRWIDTGWASIICPGQQPDKLAIMHRVS